MECIGHSERRGGGGQFPNIHPEALRKRTPRLPSLPRPSSLAAGRQKPPRGFKIIRNNFEGNLAT